MKKDATRRRRLAGGAALLLGAVLLAGCATNQVNWTARVGHYTLDQAIEELGPPDKQARLQNDSVVAEWLTRRGYHTTYISPTYGGGYPHCYYSPFYSTYYDSYYPDYFLRLTFGPDGQLQSWKKFSR